MNYYISDLHIGHANVIRFDGRPFVDVNEMNNAIIENWNSRVKTDDTVYILGDCFWKNEENSVKLIQRLKGHKHLIRGNHDRVHGRLRFYYESIEHYAEINDNDRLVILCHYPIPFYKNQHYGAVMLYGHVHRTKEYEYLTEMRKSIRAKAKGYGTPNGNFINVGCMMPYMNYTPRTLAEIIAGDAADFANK